MTNPDPTRHLSPDEVDAWLDGNLPEPRATHILGCAFCGEVTAAERRIVDRLATLPLLEPTAGFTDRVMAAVIVPHPALVVSPVLQPPTVRRRLAFASSPIAAVLAVGLVASVGASIAWSLANRDVLSMVGLQLSSLLSDWGWTGIRTIASNVVEQPWYTGVRSLVDTPIRATLAISTVAVMYLSGLLAFRRLLTSPQQQVARASW